MADECTQTDAPDLTRRDGMKLIAGMVALGAALGVPRVAFGFGADGLFQLKFYRAADQGGALIHSAELPESVTDYLLSSGGQRTQLKLYTQEAGELGTFVLPDRIQNKISMLQLKIKGTRARDR